MNKNNMILYIYIYHMVHEHAHEDLVTKDYEVKGMLTSDLSNYNINLLI